MRARMDKMIRIFSLFFLPVVLGGCVTKERDACSFHVDFKEWQSVSVGSNSKISPMQSKASRWYKNERGDYLVCYNSVSDSVCGGIYETFKTDSDKGYVYDQIVCMSRTARITR